MIRLRGVSHRYGDRVVLCDVDLDLAEHRVAVVGANGSGKSTLARMLNGLVLPTKGTVEVGGLDTRRDSAAVRRNVAFVFSDPDAQIVMPTVAEDVAFSLRRHGLTKAAMDDQVAGVLRRFGLDDHRDHPAHLLSSGQKQLLAFAAVLVTDPEVLVCDEPTTLLDLRNSAHVLSVLRDLPQQVVMATHDLEAVLSWERVVVLDEGRVVADGPGESAVPAYRRLMGAPRC